MKHKDGILQALEFAKKQVTDMHGSMTGEGHHAVTHACKCEYSDCVRKLHELIGLRKAGRLVVRNDVQGYIDDDGQGHIRLLGSTQ